MLIYLDYAATSPVDSEVITVIEDALKQTFGNPSSTYRIGKTANYEMMMARKQFSQLLNIPENNVFFTSGATEANNWALRSQAFKARELGYGNHIVSTVIEHPSVMNVLAYLETQDFKVTYLKPNKAGEYTVDAFEAASTDETIGWVAMAVNNEVGSVLPIQELGEVAKDRNYWFHVDTVQGIAHLDWDFGKMPMTSFVGSGHKFNAPKGVGFLVYQPFDSQMVLTPLLYGGGQERTKRSGTENVPYILGMTKALQQAQTDFAFRRSHLEQLETYLFDQLDQYEIQYEKNGDPTHKVPYINNIWVKGLPSSQLLIRFDLADIYVSAGSACSAGSIQPSTILMAYYPDQPERWNQSIRISTGKDTTKADIDQFVEVLKKSVEGKQ